MATATASLPPLRDLPGLTILRMGLGRDSIAMLCLLVETGLIAGQHEDGSDIVLHPSDIDAVVFTDTGSEWKATYQLVPRIRGSNPAWRTKALLRKSLKPPQWCLQRTTP